MPHHIGKADAPLEDWRKIYFKFGGIHFSIRDGCIKVLRPMFDKERSHRSPPVALCPKAFRTDGLDIRHVAPIDSPLERIYLLSRHIALP